MVNYFGILKNKGFVKGMFIASAFLTLQGNGVCYGMEKEEGKGVSKTSLEPGIIVGTTDFLAHALYSLLTGYFFNSNSREKYLGGYINGLSIGYQYRFSKSVKLDIGVSVQRGLAVCLFENTILFLINFIKMDKSAMGFLGFIKTWIVNLPWNIFFYTFSHSNPYINDFPKTSGVSLVNFVGSLINLFFFNLNFYFTDKLYCTFNLIPILKGLLIENTQPNCYPSF